MSRLTTYRIRKPCFVRMIRVKVLVDQPFRNTSVFAESEMITILYRMVASTRTDKTQDHRRFGRTRDKKFSHRIFLPYGS